jgi:DNA-binding SARP family transcriptional activator
MPVEFRVLGPLEIRRNGTPVPLRARKPRTMLGALLVEHGRIVSIDRLIDALWPTAPPAGAQHALETHATRLRKLLGDDVTLTARDPGYVLALDPQLLDIVRFEQLLAEARESEPERAATRADDALALWRGEALADFAFESFAQEEIARLNELRLDAEEVRVDAQLALGRASEIAGTLEAHVAADPGRERRDRSRAHPGPPRARARDPEPGPVARRGRDAAGRGGRCTPNRLGRRDRARDLPRSRSGGTRA